MQTPFIATLPPVTDCCGMHISFQLDAQLHTRRRWFRTVEEAALEAMYRVSALPIRTSSKHQLEHLVFTGTLDLQPMQRLHTADEPRYRYLMRTPELLALQSALFQHLMVIAVDGWQRYLLTSLATWGDQTIPRRAFDAAGMYCGVSTLTLESDPHALANVQLARLN